MRNTFTSSGDPPATEPHPPPGVYKRLQTEQRLQPQHLQAIIERSIISNETAVISLRVPKYIKLLYDSLTVDEKKLVKEIFIETLKGYINTAEREGRQVIVNVNIAMNLSQIAVDLAIDREALKEIIKWLERVANPGTDYPKGFKEAAARALPILRNILSKC
jgi:hypothetical protein